MKVALPSGVLTPEDFALGKTSFTGDLLNLLPGYPRAGSLSLSVIWRVDTVEQRPAMCPRA